MVNKERGDENSSPLLFLFFMKTPSPESQYLSGIRGCHFAERTFGIKAKHKRNQREIRYILPKEHLESRQSEKNVYESADAILPKEHLESRQSKK